MALTDNYYSKITSCEKLKTRSDTKFIIKYCGKTYCFEFELGTFQTKTLTNDMFTR